MAEELKVVLKRSEDSSFGFSLLGTSGLPHVIYDIIENSPAAECGVVREETSKREIDVYKVVWMFCVCDVYLHPSDCVFMYMSIVSRETEEIGIREHRLV